jgi:2,4-didehydro-3-deoxy-L-rhamnonate hydrolase
VRLATISGRATVLADSGQQGVRGIDVERASDGRFGSDVHQLYSSWAEFREWAAGIDTADATDLDTSTLGNPSPSPAQVFGIGLNYLDHATEAGLKSDRAVIPATFTKFRSSLADPAAKLSLPSANVDWEVELVVVIGQRAERVAEADAWSHIAGLAVGQDFSERVVQSVGPAPQFSLGKSYPGFGPIGPWLVTPDEFADPNDLAIGCQLNGEQVQQSRTSAMIWSVPELIAVLSGICPLLPGDVLFTGTPAGVGMARTPKRFLVDGDVVVSHIEGIGEIRQECVAAQNI